MDQLRQDVRHALRTFARQPLFALTAVLSLAVGIGADTTIFTLANALLLRPPAGVVDPDRLVDISRTTERGSFGLNALSFPNFLDIRRRATTLQDVYAYEPVAEPMSLAGADGAQRISGNSVTPNYFSVLGVLPAAGRLFQPDDADGSVVLSHAFWVRQFERDPAIVGRTLRINGQPRMVLGVASEGFHGTSLLVTDVWLPVEMAPPATSFLARRELYWGLVRGRLKPGVSLAQAAAEIDVIGRALAEEHPAENRGQGLRLAGASLVPGNLARPLSGVLTLLLGFASFLLVIACANLAGVLLARAAERRSEIALRLALGAGRARVVRQLLTETLLLFVAGGTAGLLLAQALTTLAVALLPALPVPLELTLALDGRVLAFTACLSLIAAVLCGMLPALQSSRADVVSALKQGSPQASGRVRARHAFVVAQVALSIVLVAGAALFGRALQRASSADPGFDTRGVEVAGLDLSLAGYARSAAPAAEAELLRRVRALPAVQQATLAAVVPGAGRVRFGRLAPFGSGDAEHARRLDADQNAVGPGYFATLGIALVAGRDFGDGDGPAAPPVAIVSQEAARRFWPGQDPLGQALLLHPTEFRKGEQNQSKTLRVVGVVRDVGTRPGQPPRPQVYLPLPQQSVSAFSVMAKSTSGARLASEIRRVVREFDANLPVLTSQTLEEAAQLGLLPQRAAASVSGGLGAVGLLLAAMGIYGVTAYAVSRRTREIGIRIALGAGRGDVVAMVLNVGMRLVALGGVLGLALAAVLGVALGKLFLGFPRLDLLAFAGTAALFAIVGLLACYVPVRKATRVNPVVALRCE